MFDRTEKKTSDIYIYIYIAAHLQCRVQSETMNISGGTMREAGVVRSDV